MLQSLKLGQWLVILNPLLQLFHGQGNNRLHGT